MRRERGMTLVEIMITLIISSIIAAATFMFFAGQQRIYDTQTKVLNIQQNVWAAMEVLARYTRAAGSGMFECVRPASFADPTSTAGGRLQSTNPSPGPLTLNLGSTPAAGLRAYNAATGGMQWIPPLWIVDNSTTDVVAGNSVVANTDIITVAFATQTSGTDTEVGLGAAVTDATAPITLNLPNASSMFRQSELIVLLTNPGFGWGQDPYSDRGCAMLQITAIAGPTTLQCQSTANGNGMTWNPPSNLPALLQNCNPTNPPVSPTDPSCTGPPSAITQSYAATGGVRDLGTLMWIRFFIQDDPVSKIPNLMMEQLQNGGTAGLPQILAEGIEDLQVSFACDTGTPPGTPPWTAGFANLQNLNGQLDEGPDDTSKANDEWWNNVNGDNLPALGQAGYCNLPTAVRLTLVARSLAPDDLINATLTGNGPVNAENHHYPASSYDQYRRRVLTTTVYPRNNKPM
jgi:prepilin-type N-terminal cleavage/methylation domain-containing protein